MGPCWATHALHQAYSAPRIRHATRTLRTHAPRMPHSLHIHTSTTAYTTYQHVHHTPCIHRKTLNKPLYSPQTRVHNAHAYTVLHIHRTRMHTYAAPHIYTAPGGSAPHVHCTTHSPSFTPPCIEASCMRAPHQHALHGAKHDTTTHSPHHAYYTTPCTHRAAHSPHHAYKYTNCAKT